MLSTTSEYAIRAMIYIAQQGESSPVLAREIARDTGVPGNYISKILRDLARAGILTSTRGVGGGFRLTRSAKQIFLGDVVRPFENNVHKNRCPFGQEICSDEYPCGAHRYFKTVKDAYDRFLERTSLHVVAQEQLKGARRAAERAPARAKRTTKRKARAAR